MRHRILLPSLALLLLSGRLLRAEDHNTDEPLDIGSRLELFVDNFLIDTMDRVQLRLHHPVPREVVLVLDRLWEGITSGYPSTVFRDGNIYRMYYRGTDWDFDKRRATHIVTCYAESKDGIHWTRPDLNLFEFGDSRRNNIVWPQDRLGSKFFIAFKDDNPAAPEAQRYKATSAKTNYGFFGFASPDGIHDLDMAHFGLSPKTHPIRITSHGSTIEPRSEREFPDNMMVAYEFQEGKVLLYEDRGWTPYGHYGVDSGNIFYGTEGFMLFSSRGFFQVYLGPKEELGPGMRAARRIGNRSWWSHQQKPHLAEFFESVRTRQQPNAPALQAHLSCALTHLGEVAFRVARVLEFDPETETVRNDPEANRLLTKEYREPWGV